MYKLLLKLLGDTIMKKVKLWLTENGFVGFIAIAIAVGAFIIGWNALMWAAIGGFCGKNWQIIINIYEDKYKDQVDDLVDKVKDKF